MDPVRPDLFPNHKIGKDVEIKILSYLKWEELLKVCLINRRFNVLASDNELWKEAFLVFPIKRDDSVNIKKEIRRRLCVSVEKVMELFVDFMKNAQGCGTFTCIFPLNNYDPSSFYSFSRGPTTNAGYAHIIISFFSKSDAPKKAVEESNILLQKPGFEDVECRRVPIELQNNFVANMTFYSGNFNFTSDPKPKKKQKLEELSTKPKLKESVEKADEIMEKMKLELIRFF